MMHGHMNGKYRNDSQFTCTNYVQWARNSAQGFTAQWYTPKGICTALK